MTEGAEKGAEHMTIPDRSSTAEDISQVLGRVRSALERVLGSYDIPPEDAEDVLQDTYLTLLYKWEKVQCPEAWLVGTLRKKCIMYWRKRRKRIIDGMDAAEGDADVLQLDERRAGAIHRGHYLPPQRLR